MGPGGSTPMVEMGMRGAVGGGVVGGAESGGRGGGTVLFEFPAFRGGSMETHEIAAVGGGDAGGARLGPDPGQPAL